jgi:hypothetical protein
MWVRHSLQKKPDIKRLKQLVDYYPSRGEKRGRRFRPSGRSGRVFSVCRKIGDEELPIGILGYCTMVSLNDQAAKILHEEVPEEVDFIKYMVENWHFTERQAKQLTPDRRSYMCISIMNKESTELTGIIYCDSSNPKAFPNELDEKFETYLPRIATTLKWQKGEIV